MDPWTVFQTSVQQFAGFSALAINSILLLLIFTRSPENLGAYKFLMIYITLFQIGYAILDILTHPDIITKDDCWVVALNSRKTELPPSTLYYFDLLYCCSFGISLANFGVQFAFRYLVVTGQTAWTSRKSLILWQSISMLYGAIWTLFCHVFMQKSDAVDRFLSEKILLFTETATQLDDVHYLGFCFYKDPDGARSIENIDWWSMIGVGAFSSLLSISCTIMFVFGVKCYLVIKNMVGQSMYSTKYREIQIQLFYASVFQTLIPFVMMHVPCGLVYICAIVGGAPKFFGRTLTVTVAVFPALDPLPNMFIIRDFRFAVIDYLKHMFCLVKPVQVQPNVPGSNTTRS